MPSTARAKRRLLHKRLLDKRNNMRLQEKKLDASVKTQKLEVESKSAKSSQYISHLESIKAFFEDRYGQFEELSRVEQENAENTNQVQESLPSVDPDSTTPPSAVEHDSIDQDSGEISEPNTANEQTSHDQHDQNEDTHGVSPDDYYTTDEDIQEQNADEYNGHEPEDFDIIPTANMAAIRRRVS